jgi:hypothetical protein
VQAHPLHSDNLLSTVPRLTLNSCQAAIFVAGHIEESSLQIASRWLPVTRELRGHHLITSKTLLGLDSLRPFGISVVSSFFSQLRMRISAVRIFGFRRGRSAMFGASLVSLPECSALSRLTSTPSSAGNLRFISILPSARWNNAACGSFE